MSSSSNAGTRKIRRERVTRQQPILAAWVPVSRLMRFSGLRHKPLHFAF